MLKNALILFIAGLSGVSADAQQYTIEYDAADGSLTITGIEPFDDNGTPDNRLDDRGGLINYVIESASNSFLETPSSSDHTAHLRPINTAIIFGDVFYFGTAASTPNTISASNINANIPELGTLKPELLLGFLLPPNLTEQAFRDAMTPFSNSAPSYVTSLNAPGRTFDLAYVPEPTSLALLGLGGLLLARRR